MNSKRIITAILSTVVTVGVIAGIVAAVKSTTSTKQVMVVPASELNFGYGYDGENAVEGYVTSSAAQNVYIQEDVIVREINVTDGQQVKKGDVLIVTDPGQAELNLAKAKLNQEQIKLYIDTAQKNIKTLKNIKPSGNASPTIPDVMDVTDATDVPVDPLETLPQEEDPTEPSSPTEPETDKPSDDNPPKAVDLIGDMLEIGSNIKAVDTLNGDSDAWYASVSGYRVGSYENPCRYLVKDGTVIYGSFFNMLKKMSDGDSFYFVLEIRQGNSPAGKLRKIWIQDATELPEIDDDWKGMFSVGREYTGQYASTPRPGNPGNPGNPDDPADDPTEEPTDAPGTEPTETEPTETDPPETEEPTEPEPDTKSDDPGQGNFSEAENEALSALNIEISDSSFSRILYSVSTSALYASANKAGVSAQTAASLRSSTQVQSLKQRIFASQVLFERGRVISSDAVFTSEELARAKSEEENTLKELELDLREAVLKVKAAEDAVVNNTITAKLDGVVTLKGSLESIPHDGTPLLTVNGQAGQYVVGGLPESRLGAVKEGDILRVMSWQSGSVREAVVTDISEYPDDTGHFYNDGSQSIYPFTAVLNDGGETLMEQEWVQIYMDEKSGEDNYGFYLWKAFIRDEDGIKYVYLRGEDGKLKKQDIVTGRQSGEGIEIISGVTMDDWIAFPYGGEVREGARTREGTVGDLYGY